MNSVNIMWLCIGMFIGSAYATAVCVMMPIWLKRKVLVLTQVKQVK